MLVRGDDLHTMGGRDYGGELDLRYLARGDHHRERLKVGPVERRDIGFTRVRAEDGAMGVSAGRCHIYCSK